MVFEHKNGVPHSYDESPFACTAEGATDPRVAAKPQEEKNIQGDRFLH